MVNAPVRTGVEVLSAARFPDRAGFCVETTSGVIEATRIVSATGAFQQPVIPPIVPQDNAVHQMHSACIAIQINSPMVRLWLWVLDLQVRKSPTS